MINGKLVYNGKKKKKKTKKQKKITANPLLPPLLPLLHPMFPHPVEVLASRDTFIVGPLHDLRWVPLLNLGDGVSPPSLSTAAAHVGVRAANPA
jgi:hypothetical protein